MCTTVDKMKTIIHIYIRVCLCVCVYMNKVMEKDSEGRSARQRKQEREKCTVVFLFCLFTLSQRSISSRCEKSNENFLLLPGGSIHNNERKKG